MSERFSLTTITSAATILNAATATTSSRITNSIDLVISIERKKLLCTRVQSLTKYPPPRLSASSRTTRGARNASLSDRRTPVTAEPSW